VSGLLAELEKGLDGRAPTKRIYPTGSLAGVFGWFALCLFAGASATEHAGRIWNLLRGTATLPLWGVFLEAVGFVVTATAAVGGGLTARSRLYLFRTRNSPEWRE
jgi:uncharacterized membrane protein